MTFFATPIRFLILSGLLLWRFSQTVLTLVNAWIVAQFYSRLRSCLWWHYIVSTTQPDTPFVLRLPGIIRCVLLTIHFHPARSCSWHIWLDDVSDVIRTFGWPATIPINSLEVCGTTRDRYVENLIQRTSCMSINYLEGTRLNMQHSCGFTCCLHGSYALSWTVQSRDSCSPIGELWNDALTPPYLPLGGTWIGSPESDYPHLPCTGRPFAACLTQNLRLSNFAETFFARFLQTSSRTFITGCCYRVFSVKSRFEDASSLALLAAVVVSRLC